MQGEEEDRRTGQKEGGNNGHPQLHFKGNYKVFQLCQDPATPGQVNSQTKEETRAAREEPEVGDINGIRAHAEEKMRRDIPLDNKRKEYAETKGRKDGTNTETQGGAEPIPRRSKRVDTERVGTLQSPLKYLRLKYEPVRYMSICIMQRLDQFPQRNLNII